MSMSSRKTDVQDCAWLAHLLEHGLLRGSFVPPAPIRELRSAYRDADEARRSIDSFIDEVYNRERLHSALAYLTSTEFEATLRTPASRSATPSKVPAVASERSTASNPVFSTGVRRPRRQPQAAPLPLVKDNIPYHDA